MNFTMGNLALHKWTASYSVFKASLWSRGHPFIMRGAQRRPQSKLRVSGPGRCGRVQTWRVRGFANLKSWGLGVERGEGGGSPNQLFTRPNLGLPPSPVNQGKPKGTPAF